MESVAGRGEPYAKLGGERWYQPRDAGLIGRALRERQPVIENDIQNLPDYQPTPETEEVKRSWWCRCGWATRCGA